MCKSGRPLKYAEVHYHHGTGPWLTQSSCIAAYPGKGVQPQGIERGQEIDWIQSLHPPPPHRTIGP